MNSKEFMRNVANGDVKLGVLSYFDINPGTPVEGRWLVLCDVFVQKAHDMFRMFRPDEPILVKITQEGKTMRREFKMGGEIAMSTSQI